jgi:hypothetical protein
MDMKTHATNEDLYNLPDNGKAEIVNGELVLMPPTSELPSRAELNVALSLRAYEKRFRSGRAYPDEPTVFRRGETTHAEPASAGWSMPVDDLFE